MRVGSRYARFVAPKVKDRSAAPAAAADGRRPQRSAAAPKDPAVPAVLSQTSRMHKVMTAVHGDDEFSVFSTSPVARQKDPTDINPDARPKEQAPGGGKLLRFFRGFFGA